MPTADFFTQYGLLAVKEFFDRKFCARICAEIRKADKQGNFKKGTIWAYSSNVLIVNEEIKSRTESIEFSPATDARIREKLIELMPQVSKHFDVELKGCQEIKFGIYRVGDFFKPHVDVTNDENAHQAIKERKEAVIIFLNDETVEPRKGAYCGGHLTFYGLNKNPVFASFGLPLTGEAGLLIAFPPTIWHEVTPVTDGERYVVITWYK